MRVCVSERDDSVLIAAERQGPRFAAVVVAGGPAHLGPRSSRLKSTWPHRWASARSTAAGLRRRGDAPPELEQHIHDRVRSGRDRSASEVVREALRLLEERDELRRLRLADLRQKVASGLESLDRGEGRHGAAAFDELDADLSVEDDRG